MSPVATPGESTICALVLFPFLAAGADGSSIIRHEALPPDCVLIYAVPQVGVATPVIADGIVADYLRLTVVTSIGIAIPAVAVIRVPYSSAICACPLLRSVRVTTAAATIGAGAVVRIPDPSVIVAAQLLLSGWVTAVVDTRAIVVIPGSAVGRTGRRFGSITYRAPASLGRIARELAVDCRDLLDITPCRTSRVKSGIHPVPAHDR